MRNLKALFLTLFLGLALVATPHIQIADKPTLAYSQAHAVTADLQFLKGTQVRDENDEPAASGTVNIYDAGTTSLRVTYSDEDGTVANTLNGSNQIVLDSDGRFSESVYIPVGSWKIVVRDSGGTIIFTEDNIKGALDTSAFTVTSASPSLPVISKTSNYTVATTDLGKCINANPTGGSFTLTLPSAASAGDGETLCVRHTGTANQVIIAPTSSQTINGKASYVIETLNQAIWFVADGANWHVVADTRPIGKYGIFNVADRLTAPPASPTAGACYIINGTPTGDWSSYAEHDVACATGAGAWSQYTPADGWLAYLTDEQLVMQYRGSAWADLSNISAPTASRLGTFTANYSTNNGTAGGTPTASGWVKYPLSTVVLNALTDASMASSVITLPVGLYSVKAHANFYRTNTARLRLRYVSGATILAGTNVYSDSSAGQQELTAIVGSFQITAVTNVQLEYYVENAAANGLGADISADTDEREVWGEIEFIELTASQGPQGEQGAQGSAGYAGFKFDYSTTTTIADPTTGVIRFSNATLTSATQAAIDFLSADSGDPSVRDELLSWDNSTSTNKGTFKVSKIGAPENYFTYTLTAITDSSGFLTATLTAVTGAGSFTDGDDIALEFIEKGDKGDTGTAATVNAGTTTTGSPGTSASVVNSGSSSAAVFDFTIPRGETGVSGPTVAVRFNYSSTTTDSDPSSGYLRLNNATLSSATQAYFDNNELNGTSVAAWIDTFDDSGTSTNRGTLLLVDPVTSTNFHLYAVTDTVTDGTGYRKVEVSHIAGNGSFTNDSEVSAFFMARGLSGAGDLTGPGSSTDNALAAFNGVGGDTLENTAITHDGAGGISLTAITASGNINTTAGTVKENGVDISPIGKKTIYIPAFSMLSRTTNGCALSAVSEAATNKVLMRRMDCDASTAEYVQFQFGAPKSFNESTVTYQAYWTHSTTTTNFGVVWGLQCQGLGNSDAIDTAFGTAVTIADTGGTADDVFISDESAALTIANIAEGDLVVCQGYREAGDSSDTLAIDGGLLGVKFHYTTNAANDD